MISCANCSAEAQYTYAVTDDLLFHYCATHLPRFLIEKKNAGLLKLVVPAAPAAPAKAAKKTVEPEPIVEEPAATPVEEPTPSE